MSRAAPVNEFSWETTGQSGTMASNKITKQAANDEADAGLKVDASAAHVLAPTVGATAQVRQ